MKVFGSFENIRELVPVSVDLQMLVSISRSMPGRHFVRLWTCWRLCWRSCRKLCCTRGVDAGEDKKLRRKEFQTPSAGGHCVHFRRAVCATNETALSTRRTESPKEHKADRESMVGSVKLNGHAFRYATPEQKADRESKEHKADHESMVETMKLNGHALKPCGARVTLFLHAAIPLLCSESDELGKYRGRGIARHKAPLP